ncbi:MAG: SpoIIIAH-like family protein [Clostridiaceae bacterium]|nr:SpoIIIAH-like family protein [Clostridiaceae bacterium]
MKKRGVIYSVVALMLCVAVYLNWSYSKTNGELNAEGDEEAGGKILGESVLVDGAEGTAEDDDGWTVSLEEGDDYFSAARLSRQQARDEAVNILSATVSSETATEEAKAAANTQIMAMAENATTESRIESLVLAKGYRDCVVFINQNGVNVIVAKPENGLSDADVAKIKDIVIDEAGVTADKIKIIETT